MTTKISWMFIQPSISVVIKFVDTIQSEKGEQLDWDMKATVWLPKLKNTILIVRIKQPAYVLTMSYRFDGYSINERMNKNNSTWKSYLLIRLCPGARYSSEEFK